MNKPLVIWDAGHGGSDTGAHAFGTKEKDWTLEAALYLHNRSKELGIPTHIVREKDITLEALPRTTIVKNSGATFCISCHFNAFNSQAKGVETIYSIFKGSHDSKGLAEKIAYAISNEGMDFRRVFSRQGTNDFDYYYMHRMTGKVETVIVEFGFIDNEGDYDKLRFKEFRIKLYEATLRAFCEHTGNLYQLPNSSIDVLDEYYKVQIFAGSLSGAEKVAQEAENKGFETFIVKEKK
ncbi:N-acetylmuramoyl-L-alanine amidase family protein [Chengkuizengella axinellae]|uniref:N-acetylmuramoyl-L-alanine amidase n=1 Tax=Chengkuizengella axinellae TaxID=3064388 RepID=A0ABT9IW30_9BACL|nr:N-acetylmuramoyl-L-alanine amidase [Chengkuizengella sp. 2205SS18-9]MDP5273563.1 N-acetylmuramoyl-L-alanine amidase [Chengkuizengella sp. 2205SS18-9]